MSNEDCNLEYVDDEPVNATDEKGVLKDYR